MLAKFPWIIPTLGQRMHVTPLLDSVVGDVKPPASAVLELLDWCC